MHFAPLVLFHWIFLELAECHTNFKLQGAKFSTVRTNGKPLSEKDDISNVKMVLVGMRHGHRNPEIFLPDDPNAGLWGLEGELQLTNFGKRQSYSLGKTLRKRYGSLLPTQYNPKEVKAISSSADRAQATMQTFLNGLYPPVGRSVWNPSVPWQPVPMEINDQMLRMYHIENCVTAKEATEPINNAELPGLRQWLTKETRVINYISNHTGWPRSLRSLTHVVENINELEMLKLPLPDWLEKPSKLVGYNRTELLRKIKEFGEAREVACANNAQCRNIMAGVWLNEIATRLMKDHIGATNPDLKMVAYASHTEVLFPVMKLLGMENEQLPPSAGFIIEYREKPNASIRILYHESDDTNSDIRKILVANQVQPCSGDWCSLDNFLAILRPHVISDWEMACRVKDNCNEASNESASVSSKSSRYRQKPVSNPDEKHIEINCSSEKDSSPAEHCKDWAEHNYCEEVMPVRFLFCRHTCLCTDYVLKT